MKKYKEIALLEYDDDPGAVLPPDHEKLELKLPETAVFAFLGETVDEYAAGHSARTVSFFESTTKNYPIYVLEHQGTEICLCQAPCGAPAAVQILDWLIAYGVKKIIATGCCGVLRDIPENAFLIVSRAVRDEGTSFHYLPPARSIDLDAGMVKTIERYFSSKKLSFEICTTWTTDAFYRETKKKVLERREEGCSVVEMECSALAACAEFREVKFGQFLFTADTLQDIEAYDERDWGNASKLPALRIAVEIAAQL